MKKNIIIAAIAATSAILLCASCQKQELVEQNNGNASGKTFTATIEGLTKTTITSEYKVNWVTGDTVSINGTEYTVIPNESNRTKAALVPTDSSASYLDGKYYALYPYSLYIPGDKQTDPSFAFPATQTYAEGQFNAPMYAVSETEAFTFKNICGVLCLSLKGTDKVKSIAVTANEAVCGKFEMADDETTVNLTGDGKTVTLDCGEGVQLSSTGSTNFYVYLPPKDSYTAGMKIVVTNTEGKTFTKTTTKSVKIERNNLYTFDWTASFTDSTPVVPDGFVDLGVKTADGKPLYWAEKNLGASKPKEYGKYYSWGDVTGQTPSGSTFSKSFSWDNDVFGQTFNKVAQTTACPGGVLAQTYDVAYQTNNAWRMPTKEDFTELAMQCFLEWTENYNSTGVKGMIVWKAKSGDAGWFKTSTNGQGRKIKDDGSGYKTAENHTFSNTYAIGTDPCVFFPAAGYGDGTVLYGAGLLCYYWSSSLDTGSTDNAYRISFSSSSVFPQRSYGRYCGYSVRPVITGNVSPTSALPAGALSGEFSVSATKKVHFSQGNLFWDGDSFEFETAQYLSSWNAENHINLFFWSKTASVAYAGNYSDGSVSDSDVFFTNETDTTAKAGFTVNVGGAEQSGWRTLSKDEWCYLFAYNLEKEEFITTSPRYPLFQTGVTVCGKANCVVLLPDNWEWDESTVGTDWQKNTSDIIEYSEETGIKWSTMQAAGAVCLPVAGYRDRSSVDNVGKRGFYWSSTALGSDEAYYADFLNDSVRPYYNDSRLNGFSVRLVTEVK